MKKYKMVCFFTALTFFLCTCNDPVFYAISQEVKPIEPRIKGVPTNFVVYDGRMYVASGINLFSYNKGEEPDKPYWDNETQPGGVILQIASTGDNLYALCATDKNNNGKTVIKCFDKNNSSWTQMDGIHDDYEKIHNIFAADNILFILVTYLNTGDNIQYAILYIDNAGEPKILKTVNPDIQNNMGNISGAVCSEKNGKKIYYLSTIRGGVYRIDNFDEGAALLKYQNTDGKDIDVTFTGIINLKDNGGIVLLIARNGDIYTVDNSIKKIENISLGNMSTGMLAIWIDPITGNSLLLAGRQDSFTYSISYGYKYGYMELELDSNGIKTGAGFVEPGKNLPSTLVEYERYQSTIGKQPVNYIFQAPSSIDSNMTLFASTQKNGVWSYRNRQGIFQWNAEGEDEPPYKPPVN